MNTRIRGKRDSEMVGRGGGWGGIRLSVNLPLCPNSQLRATISKKAATNHFPSLQARIVSVPLYTFLVLVLHNPLNGCDATVATLVTK